MNETHNEPETDRNVEIGIDGKPFEAWNPHSGAKTASTFHSASDGPLYGADHFEGHDVPHIDGAPPWAPEPVHSVIPAARDLASPPQSTHGGNSFAWLSIGLGSVALVSNLMALFGRGGGLTWTGSLAFAAAGLYFGLRSGSVNSRGYSPQRSLRVAGVSISILAAVFTVGLIARFLLALSRVF
ncbi:MAG: hypothetical protein CVT68_00525 [Actinobacteria bacterium HGW-Actinobacteria-8]|nr:MAG: hypothetical protein CVT68_00525 [Actinobacteria bacterium HGW-Actinobacteria-8]